MYWAYHALGVRPGATRQEIKKNYRKLLMAYHPDRLLHVQISEDNRKKTLLKFHEVQRAWETLERSFQEEDAFNKSRVA